MPLGSWIQDILAPFWQGLTDAQHSDWFFFAAVNPITNDRGELVTVNGWQMFTHVNSWLAISELGLMLGDPPADLTRPEPFDLQASIWPIKSKLASGVTWRTGRVFAEVSPALPADRLVIVVQAAEFVSAFSTRPWPIAHSSVIAPGFGGLHDLETRSGYSPAGSNGTYKLRISGSYLSKHPAQRVGKLVIVDTANGMRSEGNLLNR